MVLLLDQLINIVMDEHYEEDILILNNSMVQIPIQSLNNSKVIIIIQLYYLYLNNEVFELLSLQAG